MFAPKAWCRPTFNLPHVGKGTLLFLLHTPIFCPVLLDHPQPVLDAF